MIEVVRENVIHMLHTHDGSRVTMMCLWHGTAKVLGRSLTPLLLFKFIFVTWCAYHVICYLLLRTDKVHCSVSGKLAFLKFPKLIKHLQH